MPVAVCEGGRGKCIGFVVVAVCVCASAMPIYIGYLQLGMLLTLLGSAAGVVEG